jgi:hypothetical protein
MRCVRSVITLFRTEMFRSRCRWKVESSLKWAPERTWHYTIRRQIRAQMATPAAKNIQYYVEKQRTVQKVSCIDSLKLFFFKRSGAAVLNTLGMEQNSCHVVLISLGTNRYFRL